MDSMDTDQKIITYIDLPGLRKKATADGKTIVLTMGTFDIVHIGHAIHLTNAKKAGDILVVGIGNDKVIRELGKSPTRPLHNQTVRARMVASLEVVDYVVVSEENVKFDMEKMVALLHPDVYVMPDGDSQFAERKRYVESMGTKVVVSGRTPGISTTQIENFLNDNM